MPSESSRESILKAAAEIQATRYAEALTLLDKATEVDSDVAELYELQGIAFAQTGRAEAATESFRKAIALDASPRGFFNLAVHYYNIGESAAAIEAVQKCLGLDADYPEATQLVSHLRGSGPEPQFSVQGQALESTVLSRKRRYGFGRKHLFAVLAENQEQWVALGWTIVGLSILSGLLIKFVPPFQPPSQFNSKDILAGLKPLPTVSAFGTIAFFLTMVLASMFWTSLDLIDRRGRALWMIPMMLCCFTCLPFISQALYMSIGRKDPV